MFQSADIILIEMHGFNISCLPGLQLFAKTVCLVLGIVQLGKSVGDLTSPDKEFKAIRHKRIIIIGAGQR